MGKMRGGLIGMNIQKGKFQQMKMKKISTFTVLKLLEQVNLPGSTSM